MTPIFHSDSKMTDRQRQIVLLRWQCKSIVVISRQLDISKQAVSETLRKVWPDHAEWFAAELHRQAVALRASEPLLSMAQIRDVVLRGKCDGRSLRLTIDRASSAEAVLRAEVGLCLDRGDIARRGTGTLLPMSRPPSLDPSSN